MSGYEVMRSQSVTASGPAMRSQFATASKRNVRYLPFAFTEHGALTAAKLPLAYTSLLAAPRSLLPAYNELAGTLAELERKVGAHDVAIQSLVTAIRRLMEPSPAAHRQRIGLHVKPEDAS
jgi:hypothetical protein